VLVRGGDGALDLAAHRLVLDEPGARQVESARAAEGGRAVGIEHHERDVAGARVADHDRLADQRARRLDARLDVRGRHVLAGCVDDQLLLAVDDPQEALGVELTDIAGGEPAVGVDRRTRAPRSSSSFGFASMSQRKICRPDRDRARCRVRHRRPECSRAMLPPCR
jgi:hypothetical protein